MAGLCFHRIVLCIYIYMYMYIDAKIVLKHSFSSKYFTYATYIALSEGGSRENIES